MPLTISYTLQDVVMADILAWGVEPDGEGGWNQVCRYNVRRDDGSVDHAGTFKTPISGTPLQALASFVGTNTLPAINQEEGLE